MSIIWITQEQVDAINSFKRALSWASSENWEFLSLKTTQAKSLLELLDATLNSSAAAWKTTKESDIISSRAGDQASPGSSGVSKPAQAEPNTDQQTTQPDADRSST